MIDYVLGVLRTHTSGGKAIIKFRRRKEGGEKRCSKSRAERKETLRCWSRIKYGKLGQGRSKTIAFHGIWHSFHCVNHEGVYVCIHMHILEWRHRFGINTNHTLSPAPNKISGSWD